MIDTSKPFTFDRVIRIGITVVIIYAVLKLLGFLSDVLIPFFIASLLAYLIAPLTDFYHRIMKVRILAVAASLLSVIIVLTGLGWLLIPLIIKEVTHMIHLLTDLINNNEAATLFFDRLPDKIDEIIAKFLASEKMQMYLSGDNLSVILEDIGSKILPGVWGIISSTATILVGLLGLLIILLYLIFILKDYDKVSQGWKKLIPEKFKESVIGFAHDFEHVMNKYFRNQALVASTVGFLFAIGFWIIGLPMGILIGIFIGLLNMVPYLQIIGFIPCLFAVSLHTLETGNNFWIMFGLVLLVFAIVQSFQDLVLVPTIMGRFTGFNPAMILLSITVWGKLLGLLGFIIALPATYLLLTYYRRHILGITDIIPTSVAEQPPVTDINADSEDS